MNPLKTAARLAHRVLLTAAIPAVFTVGMTIYLVRLPWTWAKHRGEFSLAKALGFSRPQSVEEA